MKNYEGLGQVPNIKFFFFERKHVFGNIFRCLVCMQNHIKYYITKMPLASLRWVLLRSQTDPDDDNVLICSRQGWGGFRVSHSG